MVDRDEHHSFSDLLRQLNLTIEDEQHFLQKLTDDQRKSIEGLLNASKLISSDAEHRLMVNIEHVHDDYLLKSSKETSSKECFVVSNTLAKSRIYCGVERETFALVSLITLECQYLFARFSSTSRRPSPTR